MDTEEKKVALHWIECTRLDFDENFTRLELSRNGQVCYEFESIAGLPSSYSTPCSLSGGDGHGEGEKELLMKSTVWPWKLYMTTCERI